MKSLWKVGDLAKMTGLTVRTLRFYDQIRLFSPSGQTESGHRLYDESDLARLHQILSLKELGLSLEEIRSALAGGQVSPIEIVNLQIGRIQEQIRMQQSLLDQLRHVSRRMQGKEEVTARQFASLLQAMKMEFKKPVLARQQSWEQNLNRLGNFLIDKGDAPKPKEE